MPRSMILSALVPGRAPRQHVRHGHCADTTEPPAVQRSEAACKQSIELSDLVAGQDLNLRPSGYEPDELPDVGYQHLQSASMMP